jgi:hypothetical protein
VKKRNRPLLIGALIILAFSLFGWDYLYDGYVRESKESERQLELLQEAQELNGKPEPND